MKSFIIKIFIFSLPVFSFIGVGEYLLFRYKENIPVTSVIAGQLNRKRESYYSRYFFDSSPTLYKLGMAEEKKADILVAGRSTVLGFRAEMFHPFEDEFYNIGFATVTVADLQAVVNLIRNKKLHKPKIMIIGFDAPIFKSGPLDHYDRVNTPHEDEVYNLKLHFLAYQLLARQLYSKDRLPVNPDTQLGFGYLGDSGVGFRKDGSRLEAVAIQQSIDHLGYYNSILVNSALKNKISPFDEPFKMNDKLISSFLNILAELKKSGIRPIIFFPPVSDDFYSKIQKEPEFRTFFESYLSLQNTFTRMGYDIIRFKTPKDLGLKDSYMLNGTHSGDLVTGKLWLDFLTSKPQSGILAGIDTSYVNKLITSKNATPLSLMTDTLVFPKK